MTVCDCGTACFEPRHRPSPGASDGCRRHRTVVVASQRVDAGPLNGRRCCRGDGDQQRNSIHSILLPVAHQDVVNEVLAHVMPGVEIWDLTLTPAPRKTGWRAPIQWSRLAYGFTEQVIVCRRGMVTRHLAVVPYARTQSVSIIQGRGSADSDCRRCGLTSRRVLSTQRCCTSCRTSDCAGRCAGRTRTGLARGRLGERRCARLVLDRGIWDCYWVRRETSLHSERNQRPPRGIWRRTTSCCPPLVTGHVKGTQVDV